MRIAAFVVFALFAPVAAAQTPPRPGAGVLDQVYACAAVSVEAERLACYDQAVGRLRQAQTSGEVVAVDRAQAEEIERDAFGFSLPSLPRLFGRERDAEPTFSELQLEIARVEHRTNQPARFTMSNGQVWTQIGTEGVRHVRTGGAVRIRRAALGSFLMSVEAGGAAIRVRRTQ